MSDDNPGEKHAGGAQADAAEFQTAQRHSEHTDKGERADRVRDRLRLVQARTASSCLKLRGPQL